MKNNNQNPLLELRGQIDNIDDQIINLLGKRMRVIAEVATYKKSINEKFFIRSAREADMIKALVKKTAGTLPQSTIVNMWRKIITSANVLEQNLNIVIHNPNKIADYGYLIKEYYGDFVPTITHDSATNVIAEIERDNGKIGIFALPSLNSKNDDDQNWWINFANNQSGMRVFAKIPFIQYKNQDSPISNLVAVAIKDEEASQDDKTLLSIEVSKHISKSQINSALKESGLQGQILKSAQLEAVEDVTFCLLELNGFFNQKSEAIIKFSKNKIKPYIKVIGHYPTPIVI